MSAIHDVRNRTDKTLFRAPGKAPHTIDIPLYLLSSGLFFRAGVVVHLPGIHSSSKQDIDDGD